MVVLTESSFLSTATDRNCSITSSPSYTQSAYCCIRVTDEVTFGLPANEIGFSTHTQTLDHFGRHSKVIQLTL